MAENPQPFHASPALRDFYYVRHGQTDANLQGLLCGGGWDLELNATGVAQAETAALKLREVFDRRASAKPTVCASPMIRARVTANRIAREFGVRPIVIEELREWKIGSWEQVPLESVKEAFLGNGNPEVGETRAELALRIACALGKCMANPGPIVIVSHGAVGWAIQALLQMESLRMENGVPYFVSRFEEAWRTERLT